MRNDELMHYGVLGMKWGHRKYQNKDGTLTSAGRKRYRTKHPEKLKVNRSDSTVTKRVKRDYNNMSDDQFMGKYMVSKKRYAKRVSKYGDPYKMRQKSFIGRMNTKKVNAIQKDIDSFKPYVKTGIKDKNGRVMLTPEEVRDSINSLKKVQNKYKPYLNTQTTQSKKQTNFDRTYEKALAYSKNEGLPKPKKMSNNTIGIPKANKNKNGEWVIEKDANGNLKYDVFKIY